MTSTLKRGWVTVALAAVVILLPGASTSTAVAPGRAPVNDTVAAASPLTLGAHVVQDTSLATTDALEDSFNTECDAPDPQGAVWFRFTPTEEAHARLETVDSDYHANMFVFQDEVTWEGFQTCTQGPLAAFSAQAGSTYYVMVYATSDALGTRLDMRLESAPGTPNVGVIMPHNVDVDPDGTAHIRYESACVNADILTLTSTLTGGHGPRRQTVTQQSTSYYRCGEEGGSPEPAGRGRPDPRWPGQSHLRVVAELCRPDLCVTETFTSTVRVSRFAD